MAFKFWDYLSGKQSDSGGPKNQSQDIVIHELLAASEEFNLRQLSFRICVNMIATAMGRCEFKTYEKNEEIHGDEYYLWNYEPNPNQNSTMFVHELTARLLEKNEALVVDGKRNGGEILMVADGWTRECKNPMNPATYKDVTVAELALNRTYREPDVLHFQLNHMNIKPVIDGIAGAYNRMFYAAQKLYLWQSGQHWKVHVNQLAQAPTIDSEGKAVPFETAFAQMIDDQIKPFFDSNGAVLPEFDGYEYTDVANRPKDLNTRDIRAIAEDIFDFTARAMLIPVVLVNGKVEATEDANKRFLTNCIDPLCDQWGEEITRKRYGMSEWKKGNFVAVDSSTIIHFDLLSMAPNVEKLIGSSACSVNDVRKAMGQSKINESWAEEHFMTLNIQPVNAVTKPVAGKGGENGE